MGRLWGAWPGLRSLQALRALLLLHIGPVPLGPHFPVILSFTHSKLFTEHLLCAQHC